MNHVQLERMHSAPGFIAALDQSGGSTPKALKAYGINEDAYSNEAEMFDLVHAMRTRIIRSPSFTSNRILAAILFEQTMDRQIDGKYTGDYLWEEKGIVPILKIDKGLTAEENHVRLMKPIPGLDETLEHARRERHIFGTKERSVICDYDEEGIRAVVNQQFGIAKTVCAHDMVPIIEPEVDIHSPNKAKCEELLLKLCLEELGKLGDTDRVMFKITIPSEADLYIPLMEDPHTVRVVALSGGYSREESNRLLAENHGLIASFSRALAESLRAGQSEEEFDAVLKESVDSIYEASIR